MICDKVILFYEKHTDKNPARVINELTPLFKQNGIKSYCFEEPSDEPKDYLLYVLEFQLDSLKACSNVKTLNEDCSKRALASGMVAFVDQDGIRNKIATSDKGLSKLEKALALNFIQRLYTGMADSFEETITLFRQTDDEKLNFCTMDMPRADRAKMEQNNIKQLDKRNEYMADKIFAECQQKGDVVALVGASHFEIANLLRSKGVNLKEYYVASDEIQYDNVEIGDMCLRGETATKASKKMCSNYQHNAKVVDLYHNPELNATDIIGKDLGLFKTSYLHDEL
jgi:hypothetical protein